MSYSRFLAAPAIAVLLATTAIAQSDSTTVTETPSEVPADVTADTVLATVNGTDITLGHVIALTSRLPERFKALPDQDLFNGVLEQLIQQTALTSGMDRDTLSVKLSIENEVRALLATEKLRMAEEAATTEELVTSAYKAAYSDAPTEMEWHAQHILVETEETAKEIVTELQGGADFGEVAKAKSTGPSGPNGGDLGWQGKGRLVPAFEEAMIALEPGAISAPVQTQFGWHVIKLNEVREKPVPPLEEVRAEIEESLKEAAVKAELDRSAAAAEIERADAEIDPALIRNLNLLD